MFILLIPFVLCDKLILNDWQFREYETTKWYKANVPSTVHLDLLDNGLISDPYLEDNLLKMYELELKDWEYVTVFDANPNNRLSWLVFEGLDTHADVYLNDLLIFTGDNMHRLWRVEVHNLKEKDNKLRVVFHSAATYDVMHQLQDAPLQLPYNYTYSRKAAYHYGWDWGPRLVTCGIWKPVYIETHNYGIIQHVFLRTLNIDTYTTILVEVELYLIVLNHYTIKVKIDGQELEQTYDNTFVPDKPKITFKLTIENAKLWWPIGQGDQYLYDCTAELNNPQIFLDTMTIKAGIRIADGKNLINLNINGRPIYVKGANYIPPDMFMPRMLRNPERYEKIFQDAIKAGYNGLRVWGGGQFEFDRFYELADQYGILIWHDLMFACALYPNTIFNTVQAELEDNIRRLRIHPSIVLWNGNNEIAIGWQEWGWKDDRSVEEIALIQGWYDALFKRVIPTVLNNLDPDTYYWESSPSQSYKGDGPLFQGDLHFWGVWADSYDIETYKTHIGQFNSEYGMQSIMDFANLKKSISKEQDWSFDSPIFQLHERHVKGIPTLLRYMGNYTKPTNSFFYQIYNTQVIQHLSLTTAIQSLRINKPYNMGTFYWQINDVWPVTSWSTVDFYGCWKAGHYAAKRLHADPALLVREDGVNIEVFANNDLPIDITGDATIQWLTTNGLLLKDWSIKNLQVPAGSNNRIVFSPLQNYKARINQSYFVLRFVSSQGEFFNTYDLGRPKDMILIDPSIQIQVFPNTIALTSEYYAKHIYLYKDDECLTLDDNYFDLVPGITKVLPNPLNYKNLKFISLYDIK